jgi:hypothetical protein
MESMTNTIDRAHILGRRHQLEGSGALLRLLGRFVRSVSDVRYAISARPSHNPLGRWNKEGRCQHPYRTLANAHSRTTTVLYQDRHRHRHEPVFAGSEPHRYGATGGDTQHFLLRKFVRDPFNLVCISDQCFADCSNTWASGCHACLIRILGHRLSVPCRYFVCRGKVLPPDFAAAKTTRSRSQEPIIVSFRVSRGEIALAC